MAVLISVCANYGAPCVLAIMFSVPRDVKLSAEQHVAHARAFVWATEQSISWMLWCRLT